MAINKKVMITGVAVCLLIGGVYAGSTLLSANASTDKGAITITPATENVRIDDITEYVSASGTVNASEVNGIYIETTQKVSEVKVKLGDTVKVGDVLVEYDINYSKKELETNLSTQQLNLQNANLNLKTLTSSKSEAEILQLENAITTAEKSLLDAQTNLNNANTKITTLEKSMADAEKTRANNEQLLTAGAVSQDTYDQAKKAVEDAQVSLDEAKTAIASNEMAITNAQASLKQANLNLEKAYTPLDDETSKLSYQKQQNEITKANLAIENVQDQLSDLTDASVAHVDGTIIELNVEDGSVVNDETKILKIADLNKLIVNANVSEYDAPLLKVGQIVVITTDAIEDTIYNGTITYISPVANVTTTFSGSETTVAIEVEIENPDGVLKPGYSVDMEILVTDANGILTVSLSALQKDRETSRYYVYTVDENNIIHKTFVEMGAFDDMNTEIKSGLKENDTIVTSPTTAMADGTALDAYATTVTASATSSEAASETGSSSILGGGMIGGETGGRNAGGGGNAGGSPPSGGGRP